ncbi:hypothetical protein K0M31_001035 [Melipona bicolor]|uniref:Uncharacterized protein n=1 Tax=Melipona bicolor TaxID=60889 RepID=A0AA40GEX6_9HYME|nr:hypothetical protein K0M31_001035 [Melipona bicolor]
MRRQVARRPTEVCRFPREPVHCPQMPSTAQQLHRDTPGGSGPDPTHEGRGTHDELRYNTENKENARCTCPPQPILFSRSIESIVSSVKRDYTRGRVECSVLQARSFTTRDGGRIGFKPSVVWIRVFHKYFQVCSNLSGTVSERYFQTDEIESILQVDSNFLRDDFSVDVFRSCPSISKCCLYKFATTVTRRFLSDLQFFLL